MKRVVFGWLAVALAWVGTPLSAGATEIEINKTPKIKTGRSCISLVRIRMDDSGFVQWVFGRHYDSYCNEAKVTFAETIPDNQMRGVYNLGNDGGFNDTFIIATTPKTYQLDLTTINEFSKGGVASFSIKDEIALLLKIRDAGDWMNNFNTSESKLAETKASDKTPPSIQILSPLPSAGQVARVDTYTSFIRGKASDEQGVMNILVNGKKVSIKEDGTFASKVKLAIGRNDVLIQAEDVNANVAEKTLTIVRDEFISEQTMADVDLPPQTRMNNPDALGVVIGVESYQYVPDASFAYNDAEVFREYLAETLGMKRQRIQLATNTKATQAEFTKLLGPNGWLARNVVKGKSDIVVYFSGHGIASPDAKSSGLLPYDVDPNYSVGLPTKQLYQDLASMGARSVTVFLDACFTGQTRNEEMLIANARPIIIKPIAAEIPPNVTVISAASGSQISGAIEEKEHGLFTYYLLKGMGGDADQNNDQAVNLSELQSFVSARVKEQAAINGREQIPEIMGESNRVLVQLK